MIKVYGFFSEVKLINRCYFVFDRHRFKTIDFNTLQLKIPPAEQDLLVTSSAADTMKIYESYDLDKYRTLETYIGAGIELPMWKWMKEEFIPVISVFLYSRPQVRGLYKDSDLAQWRRGNSAGYWLDEERLFQKVHSTLLNRKQVRDGWDTKLNINLQHGYLDKYRALPLKDHLCG